jgi:hypothetical protein
VVPETQLIPLIATAFAALSAWAALRNFGGKKYRQYAVPVAGAILIIGVDLAYDLPFWAYGIAIFVAPMLFHRSVRGKLQAAARAMTEIKMESSDVKLLLADDLSGKHVAIWRIAPIEGQGSPEGLPLASLDFQGETDDEYQIILWAPLKPFRPVSLVIHHKDAETLAARLTKAPAIDVQGLQDWMVVRSEPSDFGFEVLNDETMSLPRVILGLRNEDREVAIQVDGGAVRVILNQTVTKQELEALLEAFAAWQVRLCAVLVAFGPREF